MTESQRAELTSENGASPPVPVLAGHLVIFQDHVAFRPDGGTDDQVIHRPVKGQLGVGGIGAFIDLLSPGNGGQLAMLLAAGLDSPMDAMKMNRKMRRTIEAQMGHANG